MGFSLGKVFNPLERANLVGGFFNNVTGVTSSANQAYKQNVALANLSNSFSERFAQNAHQWEMNDLQAAGFNPALTTGATSAGSIASAGGTANNGTTGTSSFNPIDLIGAINQTSATKHSNQLQATQSQVNLASALKIVSMLPYDMRESATRAVLNQAETKYTNERARGHTTTHANQINIGWKGIGGGKSESISETH